MKVQLTKDQEEYSVFCVDCECIMVPEHGSPLWWKAKQRWEKGIIDALPIRGVECTCIEPDPKEPYVVFGYDDTCMNFKYGFNTMVEAIRCFKKIKEDMFCIVFIKGLSERVKETLCRS